ncbi:sulfite exporter TauE/SafE family protein [Euzebya tangerina]|uniref:sulfite exporter TauE/SafE family protein n=1 Tax=Euzebya tangerina TaxID=591198 RepID=UPI000E31DE8C|nr:sulfite exporter TauE/SafE family protein [Euzebya tangerina]
MSEWALLALCALTIGFSKTGIAGVGTLGIVGFALVLPARESTGAVLPVLIAADLVAITVYRRDAEWRLLTRLGPWVAAGLLMGVGYLAQADDELIRITLGVLVLIGVVVTAVVLPRREHLAEETEAGQADPPRRGLAGSVGVAAGFSTMVANAGGPPMVLYLLFQGLPVKRFVGTAAWFFFLVNVAKLPFSSGLGILDLDALTRAATLLPAIGLGAWLGVVVINRISRRLFEKVVLLLVALSAIPLLIG